MLFRLACRPRLLLTHVSHSARTFVSVSRPTSRHARLFRIGLATGGVLTASLLVGNAFGTVHADADQTERKVQSERKSTSLTALLRAYVVYSMCSIPALVDWSPAILSTLSAVPGLKQITEAIVRVTFFDQFVGGDTAEDAIPLLEGLRAENKGCLFAYSVEVDEAEAAGQARDSQGKLSVHKQIVQEIIHCIDVAADFEDNHLLNRLDCYGRKTWVAVKLTAMLPHADTLMRFSKHLVSTRPPSTVAFPGRPLPTDFDVLSAPLPAGSLLTETDIADLHELRDSLRAIGRRAQERGVRIIVDAEHSWYQPAIDAFALSLQREFNKLPQRSTSWFRSPQASLHPAQVQPLIYQTYQAYLRRTPEYLKQSLEAARAEGYSLGVKLVRGAYHPHELSSHAVAASGKQSHSISPDAEPPVWSTKEDTDAQYNACAVLLVEQIRKDVNEVRAGEAPRTAVLFGTHNWKSCDVILGELVKTGLANQTGEGVVWLPEEVTERLAIGQLYGMSDALTNSLVDRTRCTSPFVIKYIPYGRLEEVMPYLSRRAIENKSVLGNGGAADERKRAGSEIWARFFGR